MFLLYINEARGRNRIITGKPSNDEIGRSVLNRKYVGIYYEDNNEDDVLNGFRLIEPYAFGMGYKPPTGLPKYMNRGYLRAYIIKSSKEERLPFSRVSVSLSNRENGWRMFRLDRITEWFEFPYRFSKYREGYTPNDKMIANLMYYNDLNDFPYGMKPVR